MITQSYQETDHPDSHVFLFFFYSNLVTMWKNLSVDEKLVPISNCILNKPNYKSLS